MCDLTESLICYLTDARRLGLVEICEQRILLSEEMDLCDTNGDGQSLANVRKNWKGYHAVIVKGNAYILDS